MECPVACVSTRLSLTAHLPPFLVSEKLNFYTQVYHFIMKSTLDSFFCIIICCVCLILEELHDFFFQISLITFLDVPGDFLAFSPSGAQKISMA